MAQLTDDCFAFGDTLLPVGEALAQLKARVAPVVEMESVPLAQACGRILAEDVVAVTNVPPYANSAVDGYAVYHGDLNDTGETVLSVTGRVAAGHPLDRPARRGEAIRIFTGAPVPAGPDGGPDTIMMQEDCRENDGKVTLLPGIKAGSNLRAAGEDVAAGQAILSVGTRLEPQHIALAAAQGFAVLPVFQTLRVAVLSSGDEVCEPGQPLPDGAIFDANRPMIVAALEMLGCAVTDLGILKDNPDVMRDALNRAAQDHDLIVSTGGMSVGEEDYFCRTIQAHGSLNFWRLAIKPGRPVGLGQIGDASGRPVPVLGLPGNPVAAFTTFTVLGRPLIQLLGGGAAQDPDRFDVAIDFDYRKKQGRREFVRARLNGRDEVGRMTATKHGASGAAILSSLVGADGFIELDEDTTQVKAGDTVSFLPFDKVLR